MRGGLSVKRGIAVLLLVFQLLVPVAAVADTGIDDDFWSEENLFSDDNALVTEFIEDAQADVSADSLSADTTPRLGGSFSMAMGGNWVWTNPDKLRQNPGKAD